MHITFCAYEYHYFYFWPHILLLQVIAQQTTVLATRGNHNSDDNKRTDQFGRTATPRAACGEIDTLAARAASDLSPTFGQMGC